MDKMCNKSELYETLNLTEPWKYATQGLARDAR